MVDQQGVLVFDGQDDCINLGKNPEFKIVKNITIEAWICAAAQKQWAGILCNIFDTGLTESGYGLLLDGSSGIYFGLEPSSQGSAQMPYLSSGANTLNLNQWHHVAGTYDGQQMKVYVDGVEKATQAIASDSINYNTENDLLIGMFKDDNEFYAFGGKIAEVRLWDRARSQDEIKAGMNYPIQGNEAGLVGYWPMNECSGNTVTDKTGKGNNGIINGATWVQEELPEKKQPEQKPTTTPQVEITHISYKGSVKRTQSDEYVEITNQENKPVDVSGWQISSGVGRNKLFTFPAGTTLAAGQKIRVYTNEVHPESGGFSCGSKLSLWKDSGDEARLLDAKGNVAFGLAYDSKGNFTKTANEKVSGATFDSVKAELGVPNLRHNISDADVKAQTTPQTKIDCVDAFRKALKSFIEDGNGEFSAFAEVKEAPDFFGLPDGTNDPKLISEKVREIIDSKCYIKLYAFNPQELDDDAPVNNEVVYSFWRDMVEGYAQQYNCNPNVTESWLFMLTSDTFSSNNCAIVDKAGVKPTVNWGFMYG
jgi:hypothetical protein